MPLIANPPAIVGMSKVSISSNSGYALLQGGNAVFTPSHYTFFQMLIPIPKEEVAMKGIILAGAAGLILAGGMLLAGCNGHRHGMFGCGADASHAKKAAWMADKISRELGLTAEQKGKLNAIKDELLQKHSETKPAREALHAELKTQFLAETLDPEKLSQTLAGRQAQHEAMRGFFIAKLAEFHAMLTPDQRAKAVEKLERFKAACE